MGASSRNDRIRTEAASVKRDGGGVFVLRRGGVEICELFLDAEEEIPQQKTTAAEAVWPAAEDTSQQDDESADGESQKIPEEYQDEGDGDDGIEIPYEERLYPTKEAENDGGDLSSSASTEPLNLSFSDDSSASGGSGKSFEYDNNSYGNYGSDDGSEGSFSLPCVRILDLSEIADELAEGEQHRHEGYGVEIEFSPDYVSDTDGEDSDREEDESLNYSADEGDGETLVTMGSALIGAKLTLESESECEEEQEDSESNKEEDGVRASLRQVGAPSRGAETEKPAPAPPAVSVCASYRDDPEQRVEVRAEDNVFSLPPGAEESMGNKWWESSYGEELLVPVASMDEEDRMRRREEEQSAAAERVANLGRNHLLELY